MNYYYPMMSGGDWFWGTIMMLLWLAFFVAIAVVAVRSLKGRGLGLIHGADPLDIIKERYARGEITKEQFDKLKKDLK